MAGHETHLKKSCVWSTDPNHLQILSTTDFDGICLDAEMEATLVGHTLSTKRVAGRHLQDDRTDKGIIRAARIRVLPIMLAAKARLAAMVVIPQPYVERNGPGRPTLKFADSARPL